MDEKNIKLIVFILCGWAMVIITLQAISGGPFHFDIWNFDPEALAITFLPGAIVGLLAYHVMNKNSED